MISWLTPYIRRKDAAIAEAGFPPRQIATHELILVDQINRTLGRAKEFRALTSRLALPGRPE